MNLPSWRRDLLGRENLSGDLRSVVVALLASVLVMATPSVAAKITNADKVDGKDAVGAGASIAQRKGKLVATNRRGYLPNNIVKKARDADRLDGLDSQGFVPRNAKPGSVQVGLWSAWGGATGGYTADAVTLPSRLAAAIPDARVTYIDQTEPKTAECPGVDSVVPVGWACFYELNAGSTVLGNIFSQNQPGGGPAGISREGFGIYYDCGSNACYAYGRWAIKAPTAALARTTGRTTKRSIP